MEEFLRIVSDLPALTIVFVTFIAMLAVVFHVNDNERTIAIGPTILTTTGILATFVGIAFLACRNYKQQIFSPACQSFYTG
jgi:hypothetical protein